MPSASPAAFRTLAGMAGAMTVTDLGKRAAGLRAPCFRSFRAASSPSGRLNALPAFCQNLQHADVLCRCSVLCMAPGASCVHVPLHLPHRTSNLSSKERLFTDDSRLGQAGVWPSLMRHSLRASDITPSTPPATSRCSGSARCEAVSQNHYGDVPHRGHDSK